MDFEVGTDQEHRWICHDCSEPVKRKQIERVPFLSTSVTHQQYYWSTRVKSFMDRYPILKIISNCSYPFFLFLAIGLAVTRPLQEYVAVPLALMVLSLLLHEDIPLTYFPAGNTNAVTNYGNKFRGAATLTFKAAISVVLVALSLELFNQYFNDLDECSNIEGRSDRISKRICSSILLVVPILYITYLIVTDTFTVLGNPLDPDLQRKDGRSNREAIASFVMNLPGKTNNEIHMKRMLQNVK